MILGRRDFFVGFRLNFGWGDRGGGEEDLSAFKSSYATPVLLFFLKIPIRAERKFISFCF